jgi:protein-tyrosine phosphatase
MRQVTGAGKSVYVHCGAGVGRAATMAAAYLVSQGQSPEQAWAAIRKKRSFIKPSPAQVEQLERFAALVKEQA